ncbi:MAG TPA: type II toxin-antitoxin system VapC family toxin [Caldilineaceae bacterium]|nr:type II toxin-antitoxin system VapC family toxin [Caldilineaceae bacterium]
MIRYMLDTNACIGVINGKPPALRQHLLQVDPTEVAISQIVRYELEFGVCNSTQPQRNQANLMHFLRYIQVLDWGDEQSSEAALIRCELVRTGQPIGPYDILIAAHARSLKALLVTRNLREFGRVDGLQAADWEQA